jgi:nucleoside-diphosphate-sugar epimerase
MSALRVLFIGGSGIISKIACEDRLIRAYRDEGLPATIVRPSHTYDHTSVPCHAGWSLIKRMREGKEVVVHGDGTSLWTLTHADDFTKGFVPLLGNTRPEIIAWHDEDQSRQQLDADLDALMDKLSAEYRVRG